MRPLVLRVAARFIEADQPAGQRRHVKNLTKPLNNPKGIDRSVAKEHGEALETNDDAVDPNKRDILPKDVFHPVPKFVEVRNLAETGKDLSKAVEKQLPKDKGHDAVSNLSQYLIETGGGGGAKPEGRK